MKKFFMGFIMLVAVWANAEQAKIGLNIGGVSIANADDIKIENFTIGTSYQFAESYYSIRPRIDLDYVNISDYPGVTSLFKTSINGVYEFNANSEFSPYLLAGFGYEVVNDEVDDMFNSSVFMQGGIGFQYNHNNTFYINTEGKILQILGQDGQGNELVVTIGIAIPFGSVTQ